MSGYTDDGHTLTFAVGRYSAEGRVTCPHPATIAYESVEEIPECRRKVSGRGRITGVADECDLVLWCTEMDPSEFLDWPDGVPEFDVTEHRIPIVFSYETGEEPPSVRLKAWITAKGGV